MRKFEELLILINTSHLEWGKLSLRKLAAISGYSNYASRLALNEFKLQPTITIQPPRSPSTPVVKTTSKKGRGVAAGTLSKLDLATMSIKAKLKMVGENALDEYLQFGTEVRILGKAIDLLSKEDFIDQGVIKHGVYWTSDTPPYERPEYLYPHQEVAMRVMDLAHMLWQASRQLGGKSTATLLKDFEDMLYTPDYTVALVAPSVPLATELLTKFLHQPIKWKGKKYKFYDLLFPYFLGKPNQLGFKLKNGSRLIIVSLNQSSSQGRTIDVIHIEELDKLGTEQSKRIALAGVINSLRANPEAKVRICCNMPTGIFRLLKAELFKFGPYFNIYVEDPFLPSDDYTGAHTFINEDVIVKKPPKLDDILRIFSEVLVGFAWAKGQFFNVDDVTGETFNPDKVEVAFNTPHDSKDYFIETAMGIDPGGKVDAFGVTVWGLTKNGNIEKRWAKRFYNAKHTAKEQAKEIAHKFIALNVKICQAESSAGSPWSLNLIEHYVNKFSAGKITFRYKYVNFEGEKKAYDKNNFVYLFKILLDYERIIMSEITDEDRALHHQITNYIVNKSESANNPDDLMESSFHGIWMLLGGLDYLDKITEKIEKPVVEVM
ncbi:hypothetical protein LCGC14_0889120 [marine sediment metagenome]|uniref:Uncharacterized protein n=1 Tax=marine sediment metagenome TaxID=412755 RepID=A0A0F9RJ10_9ZZZZ|nr:hypothetical protein [bacterium]